MTVYRTTLALVLNIFHATGTEARSMKTLAHFSPADADSDQRRSSKMRSSIQTSTSDDKVVFFAVDETGEVMEAGEVSATEAPRHRRVARSLGVAPMDMTKRRPQSRTHENTHVTTKAVVDVDPSPDDPSSIERAQRELPNTGASLVVAGSEPLKTSFEAGSLQRNNDASALHGRNVRKRNSLVEAAAKKMDTKTLVFLLGCAIIGVGLGWNLPGLYYFIRRRFGGNSPSVILDAFGPEFTRGRSESAGYADHQNYSEEVMKQYKVGALLGFGSFGVVHEAVSRKDGNTFAMKMVDLSTSEMDEVEMEAEILQCVKHDRLTVGCMDLSCDACFFYIVMPLYRGGDLFEALAEYLSVHGLIQEPTFLRIFSQMAEAVAFVNSKMVLHCDIKPDNFLCVMRDISDPTNRVALADFGLSAKLSPGRVGGGEVRDALLL
jgi:hypothetical protein